MTYVSVEVKKQARMISIGDVLSKELDNGPFIVVYQDTTLGDIYKHTGDKIFVINGDDYSRNTTDETK